MELSWVRMKIAFAGTAPPLLQSLTRLIQEPVGVVNEVRTAERSRPSRSFPCRNARSSRPTMSPSSNRADELRLSSTAYFCEINSSNFNTSTSSSSSGGGGGGGGGSNGGNGSNGGDEGSGST